MPAGSSISSGPDAAARSSVERRGRPRRRRCPPPAPSLRSVRGRGVSRAGLLEGQRQVSAAEPGAAGGRPGLGALRFSGGGRVGRLVPRRHHREPHRGPGSRARASRHASRPRLAGGTARLQHGGLRRLACRPSSHPVGRTAAPGGKLERARGSLAAGSPGGVRGHRPGTGARGRGAKRSAGHAPRRASATRWWCRARRTRW